MSSKKILFNRSTLLSLKAELLKKQEEVSEKKRLPQHKLENFKPPKPNTRDADNPDKPAFKDKLKEIDVDELEACRKSKSALEKKAELYNHLSDVASTSQLGSRFLVDFSSKKLSPKREPSPIHDANEEELSHGGEDDDSEWAEFTDCLGRTRKCLRSDLRLYQEKDITLMRAITKGRKTDGSDDTDVREPVEEAPPAEKPLLVQKTQDYLQSLRAKWEQKEREMVGQDRDIHYQDVLFDEARVHGVGYYSFSTDERERQKQMEELTRLRQETLKAQQEAEEKRTKREEVVAARVAAARARRRVRAGLPPEDPAETQKEFTKHLLDFLTKQKEEADAKAKEEDQKKKEEAEKERQKLRDDYIRDWDVGKEGIDDKKKFREMTQEEYVEQQRDRRVKEFAPPRESGGHRSQSVFNDKGDMIGESSNPKSWADVRPTPKTPPPPDIGSITDEKGLYFTSKKDKPVLKYRNFVVEQEPTPIANELSDDDDDVVETARRPDKRKYTQVSNEIAPPPTYDYYGPVTKHIKEKKPFNSDMTEAYAQGSKSLEAKGSARQLSKDYDFMFN